MWNCRLRARGDQDYLEESAQSAQIAVRISWYDKFLESSNDDDVDNAFQNHLKKLLNRPKAVFTKLTIQEDEQ